MTKSSQFIILVSILFFSSCNIPWCKISFADRMLNYCKSQMSEEYGAMYEYASVLPKPQNYLLQLTEILPFQWDTLVWVNDSLKSEDISKLIGSQYEGKDEYQGKQKLIFMNDREIADIYALRTQDSVTFIPGDVQHGSAKVSRDTWFTVRANDTAFVLKRFGVSCEIDKEIPKGKSWFKVEDDNCFLHILSDTVKSERIWCRSYINFDLTPLGRRLAKEVFTEKQLSKINQKSFIIDVSFSFYYDTGEIFRCYWVVDPQYTHLFSDSQWVNLSEIIFNMRIDPRLINLLERDKEKRIFSNSFINITSSLKR